MIKIRFLIPKKVFNIHRIELVKRLTPLALKEVPNVSRIYACNNEDMAEFYEGFLESENDQISINKRLECVAERLSDYPMYARQKNEECLTYLIEDGETCEDSPY